MTDEKEMNEALDNSEGLPWEKEMQELVPEAVASVTYQLKSPNGFELLYTKRHYNDEKLLGEMMALEMDFIQNGYEPQRGSLKTRGSNKGAKTPQGGSSNAKCPKCGGDVQTKTAKNGKQFEVCVNNKYGSDEGCDYFKWLDANNSSGQEGQGSQSRGSSQKGTSLATEAQRKLIKDKWPEAWRDNMTKGEAYKLISERMDK